MNMQMGLQARARERVTAPRIGSRQFTLPRGIAIGMLVWTATSPAARADPVADDAQRLLGEYKCYICHADHEAKAGPAYADVAARFRARRNAVPLIAAQIRRGMRGGGPWHMPPRPEVSPAEAKTMARYILSLQQVSRHHVILPAGARP